MYTNFYYLQQGRKNWLNKVVYSNVFKGMQLLETQQQQNKQKEKFLSDPGIEPGTENKFLRAYITIIGNLLYLWEKDSPLKTG